MTWESGMIVGGNTGQLVVQQGDLHIWSLD